MWDTVLGASATTLSLLHVAPRCFRNGTATGGDVRSGTHTYPRREQTSPPFLHVATRPQPQSTRLGNARSRARCNARATSTGSSMKMVSLAAPASTTIGKAEALADPAVSAPGVCEVGAGDLFEAGAGGPEPDARLLG